MNSSNGNIVIVILAAGESKRMGTAKQLLPWNRTIMINHIIDIARSANPSDILVVLGAHRERIKPKIDSSATILINENWSDGMGTSIKVAADYLKHIESTCGALIMLVDQPLVSLVEISELKDTFKNNPDKIIVSQYPDGRYGVPAIFSSVYFEKLSELKGDMGAKEWINSNYNKVIAVDINQSLVDIDTEEAYNKLYREHH